MSSFISAGGGGGTLVTTFANLPASPTLGMIFTITDGISAGCADNSCSTWNTIVSAGGCSFVLLIWYDGVHWRLIGSGAMGVGQLDSQPLGMP